MPWKCDFEAGLCGMIQRRDDEFDWTRWNNSTPTNGTGPDMAASGEWYIYIETSGPQVNGDAAV